MSFLDQQNGAIVMRRLVAGHWQKAANAACRW
jgi:hypothetical protein